MKLYVVKKGTVGKLIQFSKNEEPEVTTWTTRKDLSFISYMLDPTKNYYELRDQPLVKLAKSGYFIFGGESGGDWNPRYALAVRESDVEVLC